MTSFDGGPAEGEFVLMQASPKWLVITWDGRKWEVWPDGVSGLDAMWKAYAYRFVSSRGGLRMNLKGGRTQMIPSQIYEFFEPQPSQELLTNARAWLAWCEAQPPLKFENQELCS